MSIPDVMSDTVAYKLANVEGLTLEDVDAALDQGGRFVVFEYALSFLFMTWSSPSRAWLVRDETEARRIAKRFTIPTALLGWWCIPHGPVKTLRALRINRDGGVDVTEDIRSALTEESLANGIVEFSDPADVYFAFIQIGRADLKDMSKCLRSVLERHPGVVAAWAGRRVDETKREQFWPFRITLETTVPIDDDLRAEMLVALRKVFRSFVDFEIESLADDELARWVGKQCDEIYRRTS